jgi:hypothetical protein
MLRGTGILLPSNINKSTLNNAKPPAHARARGQSGRASRPKGMPIFPACAFLVGVRAASFLWVSIWETSVQTRRNGVMGMAMKTASMAAAGLLALAGEAAPAAAVPQIPVRVVVVTTFENGPDSGPNSIGELDRWVTNLPLPETIDFPQGLPSSPL